MEVDQDNSSVSAIGNQWLARVAITFLICCLLLGLYLVTRHPKLYLTLEMSSSVSSVAQLYYNAGRGYDEADSRTVAVSSHSRQSFQRLRFELPNATILSLRFDPLTTAGSCSLRDVKIKDRIQTFVKVPAADIVAFNQIASRTEQENQVTFTTTVKANDPGVVLTLRAPFDGRRAVSQQKSLIFLIGCAILLVLSVFAYMQREWLERAGTDIGRTVHRIDRAFDAVAQRFSVPNFIQFDSYAIWFYVLCLTGFLALSFADLNGSSIGMYNSAGEGAPQKVLLGAPRATRSDEWVYYTPDILNECLRANPFQVEHTQRGGHNVALMDNVPVWHISTLFRPQFWSFFVLPVDYAFAVYWQCKGLLLLLGVFSWLLLITRSSLWSFIGSLWLFFSPLTQWSYSWSSELPEMIGLMCLATVSLCFLTVGKNPIALAVVAWLMATCSIDFALCAYVPHLLPLAWLGVLIFVSWCLISRKAVFRREDAWRRFISILSAALLIGAIGLIVYLDLKQAIAGIQATTYPGKRIFSGGSLSLVDLTSHFMEWTEAETNFPPSLGNISEGSGFLWLAPITLFMLRNLQFGRSQRIYNAVFWLFSVLILAWLLLPIPAEVGKLFGMDRTGAARCLPALGLANITLVALAMASIRFTATRHRMKGLSSVFVEGRTLGVLLVVLALLALTNQLLGQFFSPITVACSAAFTTMLIILMVNLRKVVFALALVIPQALVFGTVNPVQHGLGVILSSPLYHFVHTHKSLLNAKWMVFSDSVVPSGFVAATGCDVYTGMRFLPDIDHLSLLAAHGLNVDVFNNGTYLEAHPLYGDEKSSFQRIQLDVVRWNVSPLDPLLKQLGIRYLAFSQQPPNNVASHLVPLSNHDFDNLWLYQVP